MKQPSGGSLLTRDFRYVYLGGSLIALLGLSLLYSEVHPLSFLTASNAPGIACSVIFWAFLALSAVALAVKLMHWKDYYGTVMKRPAVVRATRRATWPLAAACILFLLRLKQV